MSLAPGASGTLGISMSPPKRQYSQETIDALDGSIDKWFKITFQGETDHMAGDCPLCQLYIRSKCKGCPIYDATKGKGCAGSPYEEWNKSPYLYVKDEKSAQLALNFYNWLKDLRSRVEVIPPAPKFKPFTIEITSLDEARELWYRVDQSPRNMRELIEDDYTHISSPPYPGLTLESIWKCINNELKSQDLEYT